MDCERFDAMARLLATMGSRRGALGALLGAALLGQEMGPDVLAKPGKKKGKAGKSKRGKRKGRGQVRSASADQEHKVAICHRSGNGGFQMISVAQDAVQDHIDNHGDHFPAPQNGCCNDGECPAGEVCRNWGCAAPCDVCDSGCAYAFLHDAVTAPDGPSTIRICPGTYHTVTVEIKKDLTVLGVGAGPEDVILDAQGGVRVLTVFEGHEVTIENLTVTGGAAGANNGGGMYNQGTLTLAAVRVVNNTADQGGGIRNDGTLTIEEGSVVRDNTARIGGGIYNFGTATLADGSSVRNNTTGETGIGGGIWNSGSLTLEHGSSVSNNAATDSGGVYNRGTTTLKDGSSVVGNDAAFSGGGIYNDNPVGFFATLTMEGGSSVSDNSARDGAGIFNLDVATLMSGSSVKDNDAAGEGGGIFNGGTLTLHDDSIVTGNTAAVDGGGIANSGNVTLGEGSSVAGNEAGRNGGGIASFNGEAELQDGSRVTGNTAGSAGGGVYRFGGDVFVFDGDIVTGNRVGGVENNCRPEGVVDNCIG